MKTLFSSIGPAVFLACSWCWVIGMWLPVFLVRDFGWLGWLAFAVPNVIGAASVGFVLPGADAARRFREKHTGAVWWFSLATVVLHVYFVCAIMTAALSDVAFTDRWMGLLLPPVWWSAAWGFSKIRGRKRWASAATVYIASIGCAIAADLSSSIDFSLALLPTTGDEPPTDLWFAAPVLAFGFLLCPFLDATFLRVRTDTTATQGKLAFALGFFVFFLVLIGVTLAYAGPIVVSGSWSYYLLAHLFVQSAYTTGLHVGEMRRSDYRSRWPQMTFPPKPTLFHKLVPSLAIALAIVGGLALFSRGVAFPSGEPSLVRSGYMGIMGLYGLVFPAYLWTSFVCRPLPPHRTLIVAASAVLLALPFFWIGMIGLDHPWLAAGMALALGVPIAGRFLLARSPDPS